MLYSKWCSADSLQYIMTKADVVHEALPSSDSNSTPGSVFVQPLNDEKFRCRNPRSTQCASKRIKILPRPDILQRYPDSVTWVWTNYSISDRAKELGGPSHLAPNKYYLCALAMFKDEGQVLPEWLEHHVAHGVEHFYLVDDVSTDTSKEILAPYIAKGLVTLFEPPYAGQQYRYTKRSIH